MDLRFLKNKPIAILGFGREGKSLWRFLSKHGITAEILDQNQSAASSVGSDPAPKGIFGKDYLQNLNRFEVIFRSPGIPRLTPELVAAEKQGTIISSTTKLFFDLCPCPIIGVTGTKGKGTTATLIFEILKRAGRSVFLGGNIGESPLNFLPFLDEKDLVVLELSSFQLQDLHRSPFLAVITNITLDHLDHHKNEEEYLTAKANLIIHQQPDNFAVFNADDEKTKRIALKTTASRFWFSVEKMTEPGGFVQEGKLYLKFGSEPESICTVDEILVPGRHNLQNILAAAVAGKILKVATKHIRQTVTSFPGLPHRLQFVREFNKIKFYNDSAATLPDPTIAAIFAIPQPKVLIMGGSEKHADYSKLAQTIAKNRVRAVVLIGDTGKRIEKELKTAKFSGTASFIEGDMEKIVKTALSFAQEGDAVILSPASASFGLFKNYRDRGEQFMEAVKKLN